MRWLITDRRDDDGVLADGEDDFFLDPILFQLEVVRATFEIVGRDAFLSVKSAVAIAVEELETS